MLEIIFRDEHYVAINKPHGLLVHRSKIARDACFFALQLLRDQLGQKVYPIHRIDRKTSGLLLFALHPEALSLVSKQFENNRVHKTYLAIVRGYTDERGTIDHPLLNSNGVKQDSITHYQTLKHSEIDLPNSKYNTSRYSLVQAHPYTGRTHQIRKHLAHIFHPILGDRPYGCNKQNKLWKDRFDMTSMMLHSKELSFYNPYTKQSISVQAPISLEFSRVLGILGL